VTGYVCSLSTQTIVYKAMCSGSLLSTFYPDLTDERFTSTFTIFHQRYATNTAPSWDRAQPGRMFAHNGEINTVWGNRSRMAARDATLPAECKPILTKGGTDSTSLDETIELISQNGRSLSEAVRMLMPPAVIGGHNSSFLRYHADCIEPWDGPAAIAFADGRVCGAALDRNGLRPSRFAMTDYGLVVAGSEAGLVDLDPETVTHSGRLGPGEMLVVDLVEGRVYENEELLGVFDAGTAYATRLATEPFDGVDSGEVTPVEALLAWQRGFGYTREDVKMILQPMAAEGKDAVWSMGDDTPLAFLAKTPRPLYAYFRQRFAQVTNPAIDPLREACVVSLHTRLGPWSHMLDKNAPLAGVSLNSPYLSLGQVAALRRGEHPHAGELQVAELDCVYSPAISLEAALRVICEEAIELVRHGARILILSDRAAVTGGEVFGTRLPIPMAMATGAVHQALVEAELRTQVGLAIEAGDCRDIHHAAVLIGYGAGAVCPWLALETARVQGGIEPIAAEKKMLKAFDAGLAKVMSKMGISVVDSYRGAHLFDILGLHETVVERCFPGTPAPLSGIGFSDLDQHLRETWLPKEAAGVAADLPDYGWVRFRKAEVAEPHGWQPAHVKALQTSVGSTRAQVAPVDSAAAFAIFTQDLDVREPAVLRNLLAIRPIAAPVELDEVESAESLCRRFVSSAMSLGSLSPEAHQCITIAMNMLGGRSNTGEGGEDPEVYRIPAVAPVVSGPGGTAAQAGGGTAVAERVAVAAEAPMLKNNRIKQVASGRFGVTAEYLAHADEIEIKVAQGAKPGEGGQLPGHKVSGLIARLRHAQPGVSLISPPPHHDIYSIEDLAQLIYDLKRVNARAKVGVKLVSSCGVGTVAAGVAKAYADFIVIAGNTGGTGAAALSSIKYAGNPWELGLAEAQQVLMHNGMRGRVRLRTDGGLATAQDVLIAALLGADEYAFGTAVLVAIGCDMARQCHLNTCPTGIATQKPELRAKFRGKPEHIVRFFEELAAELRHLLARYGFRTIEEAIGRTDLLEQVRFDGNLDLGPMLRMEGAGARSWAGERNDQPLEELALDEVWTSEAIEAVKAGEPFTVEAAIANKDRAIGARLAGEISLLRTQAQTAVDVTYRLTGTAGQSFGAFAVEGMTLVLDGQANDFVGKGLSGGSLVIRARGRAATNSGQHVILGNVALYGATGGTLFAAGRAGERFAVRNSGATSVIEGVGDHGCEYMTGGMVAVLGRAGINFAAGMTGGMAWVYDEDGSFVDEPRYHPEFVTAEAFETLELEEQERFRGLIARHAEAANSSLAKSMLADWETRSKGFVRLAPRPQV
jgi:glutamate synthase (ferredoxin)